MNSIPYNRKNGGFSIKEAVKKINKGLVHRPYGMQWKRIEIEIVPFSKSITPFPSKVIRRAEYFIKFREHDYTSPVQKNGSKKVAPLNRGHKKTIPHPIKDQLMGYLRSSHYKSLLDYLR
jgi:hypothetical protein